MIRRSWRWLLNHSWSPFRRRNRPTPRRRAVSSRLSLEPLEDRALLATTPLTIVAGPDTGLVPTVRVIDTTSGVTQTEIPVFEPSYRGGVRVATGDVDGDGFADIIAGPGANHLPTINIYSGRDFTQIATFPAFSTNFRFGVFVAAGNFDADPQAEVVVSADRGTVPRVRIFNIVGGAGIQIPTPLGNFLAYNNNFRGGVRVAAGNFDGQPGDELIVAPGPGRAPLVRVYQPNGAILTSFFAYNTSFRNGVFVAAGDTNGDGREEIITGPGPGMQPQIRIFDGGTGALVLTFRAYETSFRGGVRVGTVKANSTSTLEYIVAARGPGAGPNVRVIDGQSLAQLNDFFAFDPSFRGGVFVSDI